MSDAGDRQLGHLAAKAGQRLPLRVLASRAGFYVGTQSEGQPFTRESVEYWPKEEKAVAAFLIGQWTQRLII